MVMLKYAILKQKKNEETGKVEWALVSKKRPHRVLKWFGAKKPSEERVQKEEKRIQFFKHQSERMERIEKLAEMEELEKTIIKNESLDVIIEPLDPAVQKAVQKIKQIDPYIFKNVTKIIVHPGGGAGQLGHVEKGPGKDPHEIHVFKDRIKSIVEKQFRHPTDPKALQDAIEMSLIEVIGHEAGHIGKTRTEEQIVHQPFLTEPEAEAAGRQLAQRAKPLFVNDALLQASLVLDDLRLKLLPNVPMTEPNLSFIARVANKDIPNIVKEGLNLLNDVLISPAIFEIEDSVNYNKEAAKNPNVIKVLGIIQDKVGIDDFTSKDFVTSLAKIQAWMGLEPNGKLDKNTVSKFVQPNKNLPRNFGVVVPGKLYRGGLPDDANQLKIMKDLFGIERVISLHDDSEISKMCLRVGLEYVPMIFEDGSPDDEGRKLFGDSVSSVLDEKPTYIHCLFGQDRTGGVIARYRTENGWPCQLAYAEAKAYGFQDKFPDMIEWFCEPAEDEPPVNIKRIRRLLKDKEQDLIEPTPNDIPLGNPYNELNMGQYTNWNETVNNINPYTNLSGPSNIGGGGW